MDPVEFHASNLINQSFGLCISPQDLIYSYYNYPNINYYRPWRLLKQKTTDFGSTVSNEKEFKICLDVQHFQLSEICVKVAGNEIIIEGKHEEKRDDHGFISRAFKRRYLLPKDCDADTVVSTLSSDGVLVVTASKVDLKSKEIVVPVNLCTKCPNKDDIKSETDTVFKSGDNRSTFSTSEHKNVAEERTEVKTIDNEANKKISTLTLREDHCRLLKPELLAEAATKAAKIDVSSMVFTNTEKLNKSIDEVGKKSTEFSKQTGEEICEISEKAGTTKLQTMESTAGTSSVKSELHCIKNLLSETIELQQSSSSYLSSTSSSIKETSEKLSEIVSDISAQLREAADNI
ncbi:unnamed protein product [Diatraea saccharalis]|uniref:SHSP domain-containing protein n=1 Tax=Diatraea saccharalis TaxID=40085 RepID=A0A9N9RDJ5_9NEOP|nr:unnamed protein product [Diatraea saccharalis]